MPVGLKISVLRCYRTWSVNWRIDSLPLAPLGTSYFLIGAVLRRERPLTGMTKSLVHDGVNA